MRSSANVYEEGHKMKRWIRAAMALLMTVTLAACGQTGNGTAGSSAPPESENSGSSQTPATESASPVPTESSSSNDPEIPGTTSDGNVLVAYFSVPETDGVDAVAGASRVVVDGEVLGNNQYIAQLIQQETGGDLFRIETVQEYPGSHAPLLDFAYNERAEDARPELATQIENLDSYDVIFLFL